MKKSKRVISVMLAGLMVLSMAGCGKKNTYQGGEGTNFPYTWKEESKGTVLIKLDGSYGPEDYRWTAVSSDEEVVKVEVVKKEKKGKISYRVTPLAEGTAQVTFTRQREVPGAEESGETSETAGSVEAGSGTESQESPDENGPVSDEGAEEEDFELVSDGDALVSDTDIAAEDAQENENRADELYERYLERYRVKDVLSEITFLFGADHSGKKGRLILSDVKATEQEHTGVMGSEDTGFTYKLWEDSSGMLQLSLPITEEGWETSWEGEYIAPEDPGIPGITISQPEKENGRYVILRIKSNGTIEGEQNYSVQGLAPEQKQVMMQIMNTSSDN